MQKKKYNKQSKELNKMMKKYPDWTPWQNKYGQSPYYNFDFKCCEKCPNNPKNNPFATGVCNCAAPSQEMFRW